MQVKTEVLNILVEKGGWGGIQLEPDNPSARTVLLCWKELELSLLYGVRNWEGSLIHDIKRNNLCSLHRNPMPMWELFLSYGWKTVVHEREEPIACVMWKNLIQT